MRDPLIPATIELGRPLSLEQATSLVSSRLLAIPRMSHRLVLPSASAPYWESYANIDLATHISEHTLPPESGYAELRRLIENLGRKRVDPSRPPWDIALIQRGPERGSILFTRVHHAITDGRGLTAILTACADEPRSALILPRAPSAPPRARGVFGAIAQATRNVADLRNLDRPVEKLTSIKRAEPLAVPALAWVQHPFVLAELKCMAQRLGGGTVNDVVLAAVAGALRMYMRAHGDDVDSASVQCKIPVDRLKAGEAGEVVLGTHLGDMNVLLPVDVGTPEGRYDRVCATMRQAKAGYQVGIAAAMSGVVGGLATTTRLALIAADARTVSCYVSNMKGPPRQMHVADGNPVVDVRCHPLALNNIGVGIAVYSYDGRVNIAVCTDSELIPEPDVLCGFLEDEVRLLTAASIARLRYAVCAVPAVSPKFSSEYSVVIPHPIEVASPVLFPADASAISHFLVGTRDASLKDAADFIHHSTDFVRMDIRAAFAADTLPAIHALPACDVDDAHDQSITDIPVLQRDCFTVIERIPMMFGLFKQTVTVKAWQVLDPARRVAAYESVVAGAGVRVWKVRELADAGKDGTRVKETLKGTCPWILQGIARKDSLVAHR
ncbi:wax ester synthase-like acyl-CoA acyltransferase domain-containing protein, partial [Mycena rebaudengoi]